VTVCLDVNSQWRFPLLTCRALSTGPAIWWGFRCGLTFLGELLRGESAGLWGGKWEVEKRFRVTEVFLAILWVGVRSSYPHGLAEREAADDDWAKQCTASAYLSFFFTDCLMSRW